MIDFSLPLFQYILSALVQSLASGLLDDIPFHSHFICHYIPMKLYYLDRKFWVFFISCVWRRVNVALIILFWLFSDEIIYEPTFNKCNVFDCLIFYSTCWLLVDSVVPLHHKTKPHIFTFYRRLLCCSIFYPIFVFVSNVRHAFF